MTPSTTTSLRQVIPLGLLAGRLTATIIEVDGKAGLVARLQRDGSAARLRCADGSAGPACIVAVDNHRFGFRGAEQHVLVEVDQ